MSRPLASAPSPALVQRTIAALQRKVDDQSFAAELRRTARTKLKEPKREDFATQAEFDQAVENYEIDREELEVEIAAFQSPELLDRALDVAQFVIDDANRKLRAGRQADMTKAQWAERKHNLTYAIERMGSLRNRLKRVQEGRRAELGLALNAPNPRQRAMEQLARRHSKEFLQLVRAEQRAVEARRKEQRRLAKLAAKEAKRGGGLPGPRPAPTPALAAV